MKFLSLGPEVSTIFEIPIFLFFLYFPMEKSIFRIFSNFYPWAPLGGPKKLRSFLSGEIPGAFFSLFFGAHGPPGLPRGRKIKFVADLFQTASFVLAKL